MSAERKEGGREITIRGKEHQEATVDRQRRKEQNGYVAGIRNALTERSDPAIYSLNTSEEFRRVLSYDFNYCG